MQIGSNCRRNPIGELRRNDKEDTKIKALNKLKGRNS